MEETVKVSHLALAALLPMLSMTTLAQAQPAAGDLTIAFGAEATTLDPSRSTAGVDEYFTRQMFEQLVIPGPDSKLRNWLAENWQVMEEDGHTVIDVQIRKDVKFHNGDPLTSADFEFSFNRFRDPAVSGWSHYQAAVERFEIVDDHRFKLHFSRPDAGYIAGNLRLWALPKKYFEQVGADGFAKNPVGTGPWKFVSRQMKEEIKFEAFADYWNKDNRPKAKSLTIKIIPDDVTRVAALRTGAVDWIDSVPPAMLAEIKALPNVETASLVSGNNLFLQFPEHIDKSPFKDERVRNAVAHAIDVDAIIKGVLFGQGARYAQVGKGTPGYDPGLKPYPYDPKKARALLAEAGYPNGFETPCYNLTTPREPYVKEVGEAMYAYLSTVGIRCKVQGLEYGAWIQLGKRGEDTRDMDGPTHWMWGHGTPGDPGSAWEGHLHTYVPGKGLGSYSYSSDPKADALIQEARTIMNPAAREEKLREIARLKNDKVLGGLPTYQPLTSFAWRKDKVEYTPWPAGYWRTLQEIKVKQ
jgi:peptide/nickel transport system substrate-binding protein